MAPIPYNFSNAGRDILIGPGTANRDSAVRVVEYGGGYTNGGTITSLSNDTRELQFAVKILF